MKKIKLASVFIIVIIAVWIILGYVLLDVKDKEEFYGFYVGREIQDHTLTSHTGDAVSLSDFKGDMVLVNFGYSHCPDVCPTTLAYLRNVYREMGDKQDQLHVLFITIDPERDDVKRLNDFVPYFHEDFIGLTGSIEKIKAISDDFNVHYFKEDVKSEDDYLMSHGSSVYLVDRNGDIVLKYPVQMLESEKIVKDIEKIM